MNELDFKCPIPKIPTSIPIFALSAPSREDRQPAVNRLAKHLNLGELRSAELDHAIIMANSRGDIHYFHASGAVLARDATAARGKKDELRKWTGLHDSKTGGNRLTLSPEVSKKLISQAQELLEPIGMIGREKQSAAVQLQQVAQLDSTGKEKIYGAGRATVKFGYAVEGMRVFGAGAKTLAFAEPVEGAPHITGAFHVWRTLGHATDLKLSSHEESLAVGLLNDPEINSYHMAGHRIQITRLEFGYLALPAFMRQSHLFPVFQIEGVVSEGKRGIGFGFGRFHHAVSAKSYAASGLYGQYLSVNPDGIRPLRQPNRQG
jgi:hypothetical protein